MESGLPLLNCLLQQTLRSICSSHNSSTSSKWGYAVFWRILPRNFPPPRWEFGGTALDRSKGNKRNWILVWEDGFCDFNECEQRRTGCLNNGFGADLFFKMSHEVYNYGEGLLGKVASDNGHKWVYSDETHNECEPSYIASWNASIEPQPKAWEFQFNSGIQSIVVIAVREGVVQLGSFNKIAEDLNLVITIQRKFSYLQSIPGVFAIQRPYIMKPSLQMIETITNGMPLSSDDSSRVAGFDKLQAIELGWNHPQNGTAGPPFWSGLPTLPNMSYNLGNMLSKIPSITPISNILHVPNTEIQSSGERVKIEDDGDHKVKVGSLNK
ncbi:hypothetical protein TanjilG_30608 [Lupinus angustifolius]|uniref:Transcription factor MYC/MYB N-terminal domain-containing protein n=1 Tax=Lupinus angustifolius TaxID=3871 RepID=A0A4P1RP90_LUPAN|nr:PREDICTED: uncharacterized protein LOC109343882 [Lupinus angustifolius]XP_019437930.1 PREDICTED: uncharacterized protein LOC109343882 [Lupinus angustifolius]OIW14889.1 hypothetical protein TanjilG_30608 [Lupinus angustifolius]